MRSRGICLILLLLVVGGCATSREVVPSHPVPSIRPVMSNTISSTFGGRNGAHNGIDLVAPKGTPVFAAADGQVIYSGRIKGYGRVIKLAHGGGIETLYAHLKSRKTKEGRFVMQGERIGTVGNSGRSSGPHLHYEVHVNGRAVDPRKYF
jgi:murein DD-endopeptidase MepM/ murein hydrolase activator NlpD